MRQEDLPVADLIAASIYDRSLGFSPTVHDLKKRCSPRQTSRVERLKAKAEPVLTYKQQWNTRQVHLFDQYVPDAVL
jgi:hypothetical protein